MAELQGCIDTHSVSNRVPDIYLIGDFNLPDINWTTGVIESGPSAYAVVSRDDSWLVE